MSTIVLCAVIGVANIAFALTIIHDNCRHRRRAMELASNVRSICANLRGDGA
jgi:hypothetical protein